MLTSNLGEYQDQAARLGRDGFARHYPLGLLFRFPSDAAAGEGDPEDDTGVFTAASVARGDLSDWHVAPLVKRAGGTFPNQIFVGRARSCDVPLDDASITRVHAYFKLADGQVAGLRDLGSQNGTFVKGVRLGPEELCPVRPGDLIRFGLVELHYMAPVVAHIFLAR